MSSLNHRARFAQQAGRKRKHFRDAETDSTKELSCPVQKQSYQHIQPRPNQWPSPQPSFPRSTHRLQFQTGQSAQTSSDSIPLSAQESAYVFADDESFFIPSQLEKVHSRPDTLAESASPSTDRSFRNWCDSAASTAHTSCASSPNVGNPLRGGSQLGPTTNALSYDCHPYYNYGLNKFPVMSHSRAPNIQKSDFDNLFGTNGMFGNGDVNGGDMFLPLDCAQSIPCIDPGCSDAVPCASQHLTACDRPDCDDAIPCPVTNGLIFGETSGTSYPDQSCQDCSLNFAGADYCCNDTCPQETRCPSPCFEEDCDVPPCDNDHLSQTTWPSMRGGAVTDCMNGCVDGCIDPRHTFQGHETFENGHLQWGQRLQEQLFKEAHNESQHEQFQNLNTKEEETIFEATQVDSNPKKSIRSKSSAQKDVTIRNSKARCCSPSHKRHQASSRCSAPDHRHICQWVVRDDSATGDASICGLEFPRCQDLQQHALRHIEGLDREENMFPCCWLGCSHRFSNGFMARPKLKRHLMVHTGDAPYKCDEPGCNVKMKTKDALDKHRRTHTGSKPYICSHPNCDSRFATSTELKTHLIVHSGQKPHRCPRCGDCFADSSNLSKHKKVHEVPKFACPDCDFRMKRWDQMRRHFLSQGHAPHIIADRAAELEYKRQMQEAFDKLTPAQRSLPLDRDELRAARVLSDGVSSAPSRSRSRRPSWTLHRD